MLGKSLSVVSFRGGILIPVLYSFVLTEHIDLLSGDDGDGVVVSGAHHLTNQAPLSCTGLEFQDLIIEVGSRISS